MGQRSLAILLDGQRVATGEWGAGSFRRDADSVVDTLVRNANAFDGLLESLVDALAVLHWQAGIEGTPDAPPAPEWVQGIIEQGHKVIHAIPAYSNHYGSEVIYPINGSHLHIWTLPGENGRTCLYCDAIWH